MEGGQKYQVPLDSGLDVKSSDQLVPVGSPLFHHNRQRLQGSIMPASLRYEHNGWACGWDVYEFETDVVTVGTSPEGYTVMRTRLNDNPTYIFQVRSGTTVHVQIWHNAEDSDRTGGLEILHDAGSFSDVTVSLDNNGHELEIAIDMITGEISYDKDEWLVSEGSYLEAVASGGIAAFNAVDLLSWVQFNAAVVEADALRYNGGSIAEYYSCEDGLHVWKDTAGGAWTVEYDVDSGECMVNGEEAVAGLDYGNGSLAIGHDTQYEDSISVSLGGEQSNFQVFDVDVKQSSTAVSSGSYLSSVDTWSIASRGSNYLYPDNSGYNKMYLLATVPYWSGLRLDVSLASGSRDYIARNNVNFVVDGTSVGSISADSRVYLAAGYYVTSVGHVEFYSEGSEQGASASYWLGTSSALDDHAVLTDNFGTGNDAYGTLTYCTCVLNRLIQGEDDVSSGVPPLMTIDSESTDGGETGYTKIENAPWWDGGTGIATKSGAVTADFKAGFYAPAVEQDDGSWKIYIDDSVNIPTLYGAEQVVGDGGDFDGHVRLDEPLAFYNQEATLSSWPGSRYKSTTSSASVAGPLTIDIACYLAGSSLRDDDGTEYVWEYTGYLIPYFYSIGESGSLSSSETRLLNNVSNNASGSSSQSSVSVYFNSGPLVGITARIATQSSTVVLVDSSHNVRVYDTLDEEQRDSIGSAVSGSYERIVSTLLITGESLGWHASSNGNDFAVLTSGAGSYSTTVSYTGWRSYSTLVETFPDIEDALSEVRSILISPYLEQYPQSQYTYSLSFRIFRVRGNSYIDPLTETQQWIYGLFIDYYALSVDYIGGSAEIFSDSGTIGSWTDSAESDVLSGISRCVSIAPRYAWAKYSGLDSSGGSESAFTLWLSLCYDGLLQSTVSLDATDNGLFTSSNIGDIYSVTASGDGELQIAQGFYIDRDIDNTSGGRCTLFGVADFQAKLYMISMQSNSFTAYMFLCPAYSGASYKDVYLFSASDSSSDSDLCLIPGQVYHGNASYVSNGYNMTASSAGKAYSSSTLTFNIVGSVAPFFMASSAGASWTATGGTHAFYSDTLPLAIGLLTYSGVILSTVGNSGNGNATVYESVYFTFNGESIRIRVTFTLSNGSVSVSAGLAGSSGERLDSVSLEYNGYEFVFSLTGYTWDSSSASMTLGVVVPLHYDLSARLPYQYNYANSFIYDGDAGKYYIDGDGDEYEYDAVPVASNDSFAIAYDYSKQIFSFQSDGGYVYTYNISTKELTYGMDSYDTAAVGDARTAEIQSFEALELSFILQGPYKISDGAEIVSFTDSSITFSYGGQEYTFDFSALMTDEARNSLAFMYTDTTDSSAVPQSVTFAVQDTTSEYQFLRQQWNTLVEVENFWWIDENTILELNKTSLAVKRKVSSFSDYDDEAEVDVDDWGGDAWRVAYSFDRGDYLDNTVARYGVTCAYGGAVPRFWTVKLYSSSSIQISLYALNRASDYNYSLDKVSVIVPVNVVSVGSELNSAEGSLNTYSQLSAETIIYEAKYSGTVIGQHILFGIHLDGNFNQWALDISTAGSLLQVVQGYGFVGLDGCLTGGEIPFGYFDASRGFSGTVLPIDEIEQDDVEYLDNMADFVALEAEGKVIGDESQQWYISKSLSGIVSHLTWNGNSWDAVSLPISNNYECCYGSPSYGKRLISDFSLWGQQLSNLIEGDNLESLLEDVVDLLYVKLWGYSPKVTTAMYLQQTAGQYAYVHYNSMSPGKQRDLSREDASENIFGDDGVKGYSYTAIGTRRQAILENAEAVSPESSDDFTFNLHGSRQSISIEEPWSGKFGVMMVIMSGLSSFTSALSGVLSTLKVNEKENAVSMGDLGRQFSQFFLFNMDNLASMDFTVIGVLPAMQSAVGIACSLDMFYSTSEGQKVQAGPGWVQHNMIAQCVAQSVTSCQWEMQQIGMMWILDGVSSIAAKVVYYAAEVAWDAAKAQANTTKEGTAAGTNYGWYAAIGILVAGLIAYSAATAYRLLAEVADALVRSICGGSAKVEVQNASSKHIYDVEGKHKYGQKSEVFMWPCFGVESPIGYTDESVSAVLSNHEWNLSVPLTSGQTYMGGTSSTLGYISLEGFLGSERQDDDAVSGFDGDVKYLIANCTGKRASRTLPSDMAAVIGTDSFLPPVPFRNENIGMPPVSFLTPCFQDYIVDKDWELSRTASAGLTAWISCKDTKLIDGEASNIVVSDSFCGVASPYCAIEVKRGCEQKYIRPWAITPNALALNQTGYNCCYDRKAYHAFDGYGQRIVKWCGAPGMNKEGWVWQYAFIANDRFKRSNRIFRNEFLGNFKGDPIIAFHTTGDDEVYNHVTYPGDGDASARGYEVGVAGEDKDTRRYALPVFSELVSTLPAVVKTISSSNLSVVDGITSLTTDNRDLQSAYKAPISVDFAIGKNKYRFTEEYVSELNVDALKGVTTIKDAVPVLGLSFLGATPYEAYFYSQATRQYYVYKGGTRLDAAGTLERFRDVLFGRYDFVNQEVAMPCVATFNRLDKHVHDDEDERDNVIVPRLKGDDFAGEVAPPLETIYNMRSGFRTVSLPSGLCYQGPNRCIINRFVYSGYMKDQIIENYGKWKRVPRERYHPFRCYGAEYERVDENISSTLAGWTHNPFLLVTAPLGIGSETDCIFEWEITFAWPVEMDDLYKAGQYAVVNIMGECFAPGGKAIPDRPVHVFLWKDLFTRTGNYGYYSFRYQSRCGAGNRERLHVWSDQYIAVSGLQVDVKPVTEKRTEILTQAVDVQDMEEV